MDLWWDKSICARWAAFCAAEDCRYLVDDSTTDNFLSTIRDASDPDSLQSNPPSMVQFLDGIQAKVDSWAKALGGTDVTTLAEAFRTKMEVGVDNPLERWVPLVEQAARHVLLGHGAKPEALAQRVEVRLITSAEPPHLLDCPHEVGGRIVRTTGGPLVLVSFRVSMLDGPSFLAFPYVLFHELIAHAFARHAVRDGACGGIASPFCEGWMDTVAREVHDGVVEGTIPGLESNFEYPSQHQVEAASYQRARTKPGLKNTYRMAAQNRGLGIKTAEDVRFLFQRVLGDHAEARRQFWWLSIELNTGAYEPSRLDGLVRGVAMGLRTNQQPLIKYIERCSGDPGADEILRLFD